MEFESFSVEIFSTRPKPSVIAGKGDEWNPPSGTVPLIALLVESRRNVIFGLLSPIVIFQNSCIGNVELNGCSDVTAPELPPLNRLVEICIELLVDFKSVIPETLTVL